MKIVIQLSTPAEIIKQFFLQSLPLNGKFLQVRPGYQEHNARPASIHISSQYSEHAIFNSGVGSRHGGAMFNDHVMYRSMESMFHQASKLGNTSEHTSDTTLSVPGKFIYMYT